MKRHVVTLAGRRGRHARRLDDCATCAHPRMVHQYDEADASTWCDDCWASDIEAERQNAYHAFDEGM